MILEKLTDNIGVIDAPVDPVLNVILIEEMRLVVRRVLPSNRA